MRRTNETEAKQCGLCGSRDKALTRTPCCGNWVCEDEDEYVLFSYARNSCHRNHRRYTVCGAHFAEGHDGEDWRECDQCRDYYAKTEMYVWAATNDFNFTKLENPPDYEPTTCVECGSVIDLGEEGYSISSEGYRCQACSPTF